MTTIDQAPFPYGGQWKTNCALCPSTYSRLAAVCNELISRRQLISHLSCYAVYFCIRDL